MAAHGKDLLEIILMSIALGMDAFSLCIGVGLSGVRRKAAIQLCLAVGICHVVFTLVGLYVGMFLQGYLGRVAIWFGSALLVGLGLHMLYSTFFGKDEEETRSISSVWTLWLFSMSVSIDALSVGFSLGLHTTAYGVISAGMFGVASAVLCGIGLFIGKRVGQSIGKFGELLGAAILIGCGIFFAF